MRKYFNMIEVTLAIGIVAIGLVGIIALFPVGFQSIRDSVGDNYVNDSSQLFLSYIKLLTKKDTTYPTAQTQSDIDTQWNTVIGNIPTSKPDSSASVDTVNPSFTGWDTTTVPNLYSISGTAGLYRIYSGANDFKAAVRIWKTPTVSPVYVSGAWTFYSTVDCSKSCGLNIEFSWPLEKPYAQRTKRFFYYEIFKTIL
ncbi:MAG: hypothetical protein NT118_00725 [Lentisphaerae bacterium]|nr:hypothetical protein [Lentisphaerota bacterium]